MDILKVKVNNEWVGIPAIRGDDGTNAYVHIKYSALEPTQDSDMKDSADDWMGVYSGESATAPTTYTSYEWFKIKGETGTAENIYGDTIEMSSSDDTKVATAIGAKADKVESPTAGNFAGLDSSGNLTDSGSKASDFLTAHQDISGKVDNSEMDIVVSGSIASVNVTEGQFVTVRGSTITGISDGIYKAASSVSSGTPFTSSDLTAVTSGALNELVNSVDAVSGRVSDIEKYKNLGSFTTESGLATALNSELDTMTTYSQKAIRFNFSSANGAFGQYYYYGTLTKGGSNTYASMLVEVIATSATSYVVSGSKSTNWIFKNANMQKVANIESTFGGTSPGGSTNTFTFTLPNGQHGLIMCASGLFSVFRSGSTLYNSTIPSGFTASLSGDTVTISRSSETDFSIHGIIMGH